MTCISIDTVIYEIANDALNNGTEEKKTMALSKIKELINNKPEGHKEFFRDEYGRIYTTSEDCK